MMMPVIHKADALTPACDVCSCLMRPQMRLCSWKTCQRKSRTLLATQSMAQVRKIQPIRFLLCWP